MIAVPTTPVNLLFIMVTLSHRFPFVQRPPPRGQRQLGGVMRPMYRQHGGASSPMFRRLHACAAKSGAERTTCVNYAARPLLRQLHARAAKSGTARTTRIDSAAWRATRATTHPGLRRQERRSVRRWPGAAGSVVAGCDRASRTRCVVQEASADSATRPAAPQKSRSPCRRR